MLDFIMHVFIMLPINGIYTILETHEVKHKVIKSLKYTDREAYYNYLGEWERGSFLDKLNF